MTRMYRLVIDHFPPEQDRHELLELVLAAASLDIQIQLVLKDEAFGLMWPSVDKGWKQVLDLGLAEVLLLPPDGFAGVLPSGVCVVGADQLSGLPGKALELVL